MEILPPKISVVVITYNQEDIISRALDSILCQKGYVFEIIICDDCSTDRNWEVILEYQSKYPDLIKPHRNDKNLGIFKNLESTWSKPVGDLILFLAGDDAILPGLFQKVFELIEKEKIKYNQGSYSIFTDSMIIKPDGSQIRKTNHLIAQGHSSISLKIRGLIGSLRGVLHSKELISKLEPVHKYIGIYTDGLYDTQFHIHSERNYYIDFVGGIYYSGIGVASKTKKTESLRSLVQLYAELSTIPNLDKKDIAYLKLKKGVNEFYLNPSFKKYLLSWKLYIKSIRINYGYSFLNDFKAIIKMSKILLSGKS